MVETKWGKPGVCYQLKQFISPDPGTFCGYFFIYRLCAAFAFGFAFLSSEYRKTPSRAIAVPAVEERIHFRNINWSVNS
jgi:hypothetical protein